MIFHTHPWWEVVNMSNIGHTLWLVFMCLNGLKPSYDKSNLILHISCVKTECISLNFCHASPLAEYLNASSFIRFSSCHLKFFDVLTDINNFYSLSIKRKCHINFEVHESTYDLYSVSILIHHTSYTHFGWHLPPNRACNH